MSIYVVAFRADHASGPISAVSGRAWKPVFSSRRKSEALRYCDDFPAYAAVYTLHDGVTLHRNAELVPVISYHDLESIKRETLPAEAWPEFVANLRTLRWDDPSTRANPDDFDTYGEYGRSRAIEPAPPERTHLPRGRVVTDPSRCPFCGRRETKCFAALGNTGWYDCDACGRDFMGPAPRGYRPLQRREKLPEIERPVRRAHRHPQLNPFRNHPDPGWWQAVHKYVSPRERELTPYEAWVRVIAYGIKDGDPSSIRTAAKAMSTLVPRGAWVIPAPASRAGTYGGVMRLAMEIATAVGGNYAEPIARATTVESSHERRRAGGVGLTVEEHMASMESRMRGPCPPGRPVVIVDNVATSGATLEAVKRLMGPGCDVRAVVWAEAQETGSQS